jgi:hypothetical protein
VATYLCRFEWLSRSTFEDRRCQARAMREQVAHMRRFWPPEGRQLDESLVATICMDLDALSARWSRLAIGASMSVEWPHLTEHRAPDS